MDFRRPLRVIAPSLDGDVLAALARGEVEVSGRELHRLVGHASEEGVRRAAERLTRQGIVRRRLVGRSRLYSLNREHLAAVPVQHLANLRGQLIERLRDAVAGWNPPPTAVVLFGSVARGTAAESSDLDLLVIRNPDVDPEFDAWSEQVSQLAHKATAWTGNDTRILELSEDDVLSAEPEPVVLEALTQGIDLVGGRALHRRLKRSSCQ